VVEVEPLNAIQCDMLKEHLKMTLIAGRADYEWRLALYREGKAYREPLIKVPSSGSGMIGVGKSG
jgi:hypothetical protein